MSGICGILALGGTPLDRHALARMMNSLAKLGPDGSGTWADDNAALGHQKMAITPESEDEAYPVTRASSGVVLTADARLDDREFLAKRLGLRPEPGLKDSTLILAAYEKWGTEFPQYLVGEFAMALWDYRRRRLLLVTDPMGIRPLYWTELAGKYVAFASEQRAILALDRRFAALNSRRLAMLGVSALTVLLEPEATCFDKVMRVPPASIMIVTERNRLSVTYWKPEPKKHLKFKSAQEVGEALQDELRAAVDDRLRSTGPIASLLSGGLDSSAIVGTASHLDRLPGGRLLTLSLVPASPGDDPLGERRYVEQFAGAPNLDMQFVSATDRGPFDHLEELVASGALCSFSFQHFLYTALVRQAREGGTRAILDGHGGELSASVSPTGYLPELLLTGRWISLLRELRQLARGSRGLFPLLKRQLVRPLIPRAVLERLARGQAFSHPLPYPLRPAFTREVLGSEIDWIQEQVQRLYSEYPDHRRNMVSEIAHEQNDLRQRSHAGFAGYQDVQFTYPFLDRRMIEFSLAVDGTFKQSHGLGRQLLRSGMQGIVPNAILERSDKAPFCPDYAQRYSRSRDRMRAKFEAFARNAELAGIIDFEAVLGALREDAPIRSSGDMRLDYTTQVLVPNAAYMCYFLNRFKI